MNKVEKQALSVRGNDRFEKRDNLAKWLISFLNNDPDCDGFTIEEVNLPNNELMRMIFFQAYLRNYAWIDYIRDNLLDSSRLEYIDEKMDAHIIFEDDFGVIPAFDIFMDHAATYGMTRVASHSLKTRTLMELSQSQYNAEL